MRVSSLVSAHPTSSALVVALTTQLAGCAGSPSARLEEKAQSVQLDNYNFIGIIHGGFAVDWDPQEVTTGLDAQGHHTVTSASRNAAMGALFVPLRDDDGNVRLGIDGTPLRQTCGVTFISTHYAVTAASCVSARDVPDPASTRLRVEQYDVSAPVLPGFTQAAVELPFTPEPTMFPDYKFHKLTSALGYLVTGFDKCRVVKRCSSMDSDPGTYDCPTASAQADVALLRCDDREPGAGWFPVAEYDEYDDVRTRANPVKVYWFDELLKMPLNPPTLSEGQDPMDPLFLAQLDRYQHYTLFAPADYAQNFHFYDRPRAATEAEGAPLQPLPLASAAFWIDDPALPGNYILTPHRRSSRTGVAGAGLLTWTDLWGCEATRGGGVLQPIAADPGHMQYALLGPVVAIHDMKGRLCQDAGTMVPGKNSLAYPELAATRFLAETAAAEPYGDRRL